MLLGMTSGQPSSHFTSITPITLNLQHAPRLSKPTLGIQGSHSSISGQHSRLLHQRHKLHSVQYATDAAKSFLFRTQQQWEGNSHQSDTYAVPTNLFAHHRMFPVSSSGIPSETSLPLPVAAARKVLGNVRNSTEAVNAVYPVSGSSFLQTHNRSEALPTIRDNNMSSTAISVEHKSSISNKKGQNQKLSSTSTTETYRNITPQAVSANVCTDSKDHRKILELSLAASKRTKHKAKHKDSDSRRRRSQEFGLTVSKASVVSLTFDDKQPSSQHEIQQFQQQISVTNSSFVPSEAAEDPDSEFVTDSEHSGDQLESNTDQNSEFREVCSLKGKKLAPSH